MTKREETSVLTHLCQHDLSNHNNTDNKQVA